MRRTLAALAVLLPGLCAAQADAGPGTVVEQVVAVVRTASATQPRIITLTRLREEARIALVSQGATGAATADLDQAALQAGLDWLIDQTLLLDEVVRLQVFEVDRLEVLEELGRFKARLGTPAAYRRFLDRWDITEEELLVVVRRMLRVQRYVDSRISSASRVPEADVDRLLRDQGVDSRADKPALRAAARARLAAERTGREVRALLADLRSRATVRVLEPFSARRG